MGIATSTSILCMHDWYPGYKKNNHDKDTPELIAWSINKTAMFDLD